MIPRKREPELLGVRLVDAEFNAISLASDGKRRSPPPMNRILISSDEEKIDLHDDKLA